MFLQDFGDHPNVIKLHNVIKADNDKDIYLVFEFMGKLLSFEFYSCVYPHACTMLRTVLYNTKLTVGLLSLQIQICIM